MNRSISRRAWATAAALWALGARAQPARAAVSSIVVPFAGGSTADLGARRFAQAAADAGGPPFVVENLPGASGVIATRELLRRPADGRSVLWANSGLVCTTPLLAPTPVGYDTTRDLVPACIFLRSPQLLFAARDFPADTLDDLRRLARRQQEPFTYVGADVGGANHLAGEVLFQRLGVRATFVPYRNNSHSMIDVAEGRVQLGIYVWNNLAPMLRGDRVKVLAVLSDTRLPAAPQYATVADQGLGAWEMQGWFGLFLPRDTPSAVVAEHERLMQQAQKHRDFMAFATESGQEFMWRGSRDAPAFVESEVERYRALLRRLKLAWNGRPALA